MTPNSPMQVAVYARYSTDRQDARSIDDQIRRCRAYAAAHGFEVVAEYKDAAVSGSHAERADMQRLLARARGGAPWRALLVDDLSRLSRDLGNTWQIVFHDLASAQVRVVDVTTGMSSDGAGARLTFGAMALVNDTFLQLVRSETHRGLEGRALAGFSAGGRCYGYATVDEQNPPDPSRPRKVLVVDPDQAAVVLRVFREFVAGASTRQIAFALNRDGLRAPNDDGRGNKTGRGWSHTTVRSLVQNDRYLGRIVWNQTKSVRVPGRKSRKRVVRPESEWVTREHAELAIVPRELWDRAQARFNLVYSSKPGRPAGTGQYVYLMTGLMRCGACGGSMTVMARRKTSTATHARFGCTAHHSRGDAICPNGVSVSERRVSRALVDALKELLDRPGAVERFVERFRQQSRARAVPTQDDGLGRRVRESERRVANLTEALAKTGWSDALASRLREEEARLGQLKAERAAAAKTVPERPVPHPAVVAKQFGQLLSLLEADVARGRELLSRFVSPLIMTPVADSGGYRLTGALDLSSVLGVSRMAANDSCGGSVSQFADTKTEAIWVPFDRLIPAGR